MRLLIRALVLVLAVGAPVVVAGQGTFEDTSETAYRLTDAGADPTPVPQTLVLDWASAPRTPTPSAPTTPDPTPVETPHHHHEPEPTAATRTVAAAPDPTAPSAPHTHPPTPRPTPRPTQPPASTTGPSTPPPNSDYDPEQVKQEIREAWEGDDDKAVDVVGCETGGSYDPRTYNSTGPYYGLWQMTQGTWERYGGSGDPRDASPHTQTRVAWRLFQDRGWSPWPGCT